ncbi:MAG: hydroxymethylbilane synthase [Planctomycetes bacterium]|nr:hydroxymethylbilane synthase [Planctomycetota bacterium]
MRSIKIASRASKLALTQSNYARALLLELDPDLDIQIVEISTKGDRDKSDFLYKTSSVGFFTSEVENALLDGRADLAVHSLKDLPTAITEGLVIAAIPKRESVADALITNTGASSIADLPSGASVGTSSLRRIAQVNHIRDDLNCVPLRGNVETRVNKVAAGQVDAAIVACAGLNRLKLSDKISAALPPDEFIPAPAQGALAFQIRTDNPELNELVSKLNDQPSRITAETERSILATMHGGCSIPLGVYSYIDGDTINIEAMISDVEGKNLIKLSKSAPLDQRQQAAKALAEELLNKGGRQILDNIRDERENPSD